MKTSMSLYELLYLIVTTGGFIAVSVQLWIQRRQIRSMDAQTKLLANTLGASTNTSVAQRQLEVDRLFVEKPHLYRYFLGGCIPDSKYKPQALSMAVLLVNYFDTYFLQKGQFPQLYTTETWEAYISSHFANSPFLCQYLRENAKWYTKDLYDLMVRATSTQVKITVGTDTHQHIDNVQSPAVVVQAKH